MGSDKHHKSSKKEKKSEKSDHHKHSRKDKKSHKKDSKSESRKTHKHSASGSLQPLITEEDYFTKSQEFRVWLKLQQNLNFEDLTSKEARKLFDTEFISEFNSGMLAKMYYTGDIPLELRKVATKSQHKWTFKLSSKDEEQLHDLSEDVDIQSKGGIIQ